MTAHPLDRAVWSALTGRQAHLAIVDGAAMRFVPDVSPIGAVDAFTEAAVAAVGRLIADHGSVAFLQNDPVVLPPGAVIERAGEGVQMVAGPIDAPAESLDVVELGDADSPEMLALATLTAPGPFLPRTHILGDFIGVRQGGRLIAMAGERLKPEGHTEVSGVCTHPDARGRGLAGTLTRIVARRIQDRGETAFLHAYAVNVGAIALYERLGFRTRRRVMLTIVGRGTP